MSLKSIKDYEGLRLTPYRDSLGFWTVGYGHLVIPKDNLHLTQKITLDRAEELYQNDLAIAVAGVHRLMPSWASLDPEAVEILTNLCFNLGETKLSAFKRTLSSFASEQYADAADNLRDSRWFMQVGRRGTDIVDALNKLGNK